MPAAGVGGLCVGVGADGQSVVLISCAAEAALGMPRIHPTRQYGRTPVPAHLPMVTKRTLSAAGIRHLLAL
eukprot:COSAG01_NODE_50353_length_364_cov_0.588679_1_plen_70_part_10